MTDSPLAAAFQVAMRALARREYATSELIRKLEGKDFDTEVIAETLHTLQQENRQSDERFAETFVRSKINRGIGRFRIQKELEQRDVLPSLIRSAFDEAECDWFALALSTWKRKYPDTSDLDIREKARRFRFMSSRGFDHDQIHYALEQARAHSDC